MGHESGPDHFSHDDPYMSTAHDDLGALTDILSVFKKVPPESRERLLQTVATFLGLRVSAPDSLSEPPRRAQGPADPSFSEDRSLSPKQFLLEKQPRTDVERVACLAYYLTHYRDMLHFKTLDISTLNTEAAQVKFSNAADSVENATKQRYLVAANKGAKQLSALGEQFVLALPDRDRARTIMTVHRPRRRSRRSLLETDGQ